jgi:hypothetical protein
MIILIDRSFAHLITLENPFINIFIRPVIDVTDCEQDPFIYIIIERYTFKEFYSVIIDISAFKKFIISYKQYLVYKTIINDNTDIDII